MQLAIIFGELGSQTLDTMRCASPTVLVPNKLSVLQSLQLISHYVSVTCQRRFRQSTQYQCLSAHTVLIVDSACAYAEERQCGAI